MCSLQIVSIILFRFICLDGISARGEILAVTHRTASLLSAVFNLFFWLLSSLSFAAALPNILSCPLCLIPNALSPRN